MVNGFTYSYNSSEDEQVTNSETETIIRYTEGEPTVNGSAYDSTDKNAVYRITQVTDDAITVDGDVLTLVDNGIDGVKEISGLDRFNGQKVTIMADTSVYEGFDVSNGVLVLPVLANNVLVGLPYEGTIETIPNEIKFSSGNSTVGIDRKLTTVYWLITAVVVYGMVKTKIRCMKLNHILKLILVKTYLLKVEN